MRKAYPIYIFLLVLSVPLFLSGCARYQMGNHTEFPFKTIYIQPVENKSFAPQSQAVISRLIAREFERDGRLLVTSKEAAEVTLITNLLEINRSFDASTEDDTRFARKIVITLVADCTLINTLTGKPYFSNREVLATTDTYTDSGHIQAEYQAIPVLSQRLASNISHLVLDIW
jgi:hypothetical protein